MKVELLYHTPLWVASKAIRKCWASEDKSDSHYDLCEIDFICGTKDRALIERVGNQNKHKSTLEHLVYTFDIDGISRACLQEVARHRLASYSVKSTRYTLKELKELHLKYTDRYELIDGEEKFISTEYDKKLFSKFVVFTDNEFNNGAIARSLVHLCAVLRSNVSNDIAKYCLPEAYKTSLVMTINARSLQNFLELRSSKHALWEIQQLSNEVYNALPEEHKYLFKEYHKGLEDENK